MNQHTAAERKRKTTPTSARMPACCRDAIVFAAERVWPLGTVLQIVTVLEVVGMTLDTTATSSAHFNAAFVSLGFFPHELNTEKKQD